MVQKVDKYGKRVDKQDTMMQSFYKIDANKEDKSSKYYDEDGKFKWDQEESD